MLLRMSLGGAALIVLTAAFRGLFRDRTPKGVFLVLWKIALLRLLIPVSFAVPGAVSHPGRGGEALGLVGGGISAILEAAIPSEGVGGTSWTPPSPSRVPSPAPAPAPVTGGVETGTILTVLWLVGAAVCAGWFLFTYLRSRRENRASTPLKDGKVQAWLAAHNLLRRVELRTLPGLTTPLTYGVLRPVILAPEDMDWESGAADYMLCHEYVHIRRFDTLTKLLAAAALCVHWFNPAVWLLWVLLNRDIELACDEAVVRHFGRERRAEYARMLIHMEERRMRPEPLMNRFAGSAIEERIRSIMKIKKNTVISIILAVVLVVAAVGVFTASALTPEDPKAPEDPAGFQSFGAYMVTGVVAGSNQDLTGRDDVIYCYHPDVVEKLRTYEDPFTGELIWAPNETTFLLGIKEIYSEHPELLTATLFQDLGFFEDEVYTDIDLATADIKIYTTGNRYESGENAGVLRGALFEVNDKLWVLEFEGHGPAIPVIYELTRISDDEFKEIMGVDFNEYFETKEERYIRENPEIVEQYNPELLEQYNKDHPVDE